MVTTRELRDRADDEPITMLTAYDAPTAAVIERAGIDAILVGDSMGNAVLGYDSTLPVTLDEVASRTAAVARAVDDPLVIADMPFLSFGVSEANSVENAGRLVKEADADAVKLESGPHTVAVTRRLTELGIPVMAHLGLTPQHVNRLGYQRQGTEQETAEELLEVAEAHEEAGAFALVLEYVPANLARDVTRALNVPTIGIGAGPETDGQVLVVSDVFGTSDRTPPFAEAFGDVEREMERAVDGFHEAVHDGSFPAEEHTHYEDELDELY